MKTNKLKNYVKLGIILFSISLLLTNCQNDLEEKNEIQNNEPKHKIQLHSKSQIANNVNVISKIKKLNTNIKNKKETKSVYSDLYDFTIETDYALYAEFEDGTYSYTFPISRETAIDGIENFVLTLTLDGELRAQYFKYDLTHEEYLSYGTDPSLLDKVTIITIEDNDLILEVNQVKYDGGDSGWSWEIVGGYWNEWAYSFQRRQEWINVFGWVYHDSTDITDFDPCYNCDAGAGNNNTDGSASGSSGHNSTVTTPLSFVDLWFIIGLNNALDLTDDQNAWIVENENNYLQAQNILNYLNANPNSLEAQNFAIDAMEAIENGGDVDFDDTIIIDLSYLNNNCLSNVYTTLNNNSSRISTYLNNFMGENSVANLKLQTSTSLPDNINAETSPPNNYLITITFNANNLNRPSLSIARTFIHELIHAEMFRKLLSVWQSPSLNGLSYSDLENMRNDFPGLIDYYTRWKLNIPAGINLTSAQHQAMAQHYRDIIKQALKDFDNTQTENVYNALSWVGLHNTIAWNNLPQSEINTINQTIINFNLNNQNCQ